MIALTSLGDPDIIKSKESPINTEDYISIVKSAFGWHPFHLSLRSLSL